MYSKAMKFYLFWHLFVSLFYSQYDIQIFLKRLCMVKRIGFINILIFNLCSKSQQEEVPCLHRDHLER